ncbi:MAG: aminotransferase class I/II-fold pyridoxal phosphate-dependent enzyme [Acidaminococcus sp.]|nr:aminotransferase class I/II-fold pyridoxal phosphate-dependent enzyme [Acidaminococcus sp.]
MDYKELTKEVLEKTLADELKLMKKYQKEGKVVDMTRGRPCREQLDLSVPMFDVVKGADFMSQGIDVRNYGGPLGTKESRELFADILGVKADEVITADSSSLSIMYDVVQFAKQFGVLGSIPWNKLPKAKFICPAPGYDRHFAICEALGIEMITVPMLSTGPDMDLIEPMVKADASIKGIWCVPKYSNPTGITYSDEVVERLATMPVAAEDFRIFWDTAYSVHSLYDTDDKLKNIFDVAKKAGTENRIYEFASTSKVTFASAGISCIATSEANVNELKAHMFYKTIGPNKVNQYMHALFLKDKDGVLKLMAKHADILRPKFQAVDKALSDAFDGDRWVKWSKPNGGYFISVDVKNCAKRIVELSKEAGVSFTKAGSTFPYGMDDYNMNIRIAPSVPNLDELNFAMKVFVSAIKIARMELVLQKCFKG